MLRITLILLPFFLLLNNCCLSQVKPIAIHSSVGDTIDAKEKVKYFLFEKINSEEYLFSVFHVSQKDSVLTHYTKKDTADIRIDKTQIAEICYNINRLDAYFSSDSTAIDSKKSLVRDPKADILNRGNYSYEKIELSEKEKKEVKAFSKENIGRTSPSTMYNLDKVQQQNTLPPVQNYPTPKFTPPSSLPH